MNKSFISKSIILIIFSISIIGFISDCLTLQYETYVFSLVFDIVIKGLNISILLFLILNIDSPLFKVFRLYFFISLFWFFAYGFGRTILIISNINLAFILRIIFYVFSYYFIFIYCFMKKS